LSRPTHSYLIGLPMDRIRLLASAVGALALALAAGAGRGRAETHDGAAPDTAADTAADRILRRTTVGFEARKAPGKSPRDLAARWIAAMSVGTTRDAINLITPEWWSSCLRPAWEAEHARGEAVARALGGVLVDLRGGAKLTKAEPLSRQKRIKKGEELDGCLADADLIVQRWRFTARKGKDKPIGQEYELIAIDGQWALRAP